MQISSRLPDVGTTIFTIMSKMAADHDAINLSQGYPDFDVPAELLQRLDRYARDGFNQYPPMHGIPYLREQIAEKISDCYGHRPDPENEITVTSGATEALFVAIQAVTMRGSEVIVFDPAYDAYDPAVSLAGGKTIHLPLIGAGFSIDWAALAQAINKNTTAIILNSPHNPTGSTLVAEDLERLAELINDTNICLISDEVYEHMVFDDQPHCSLLTHPALRERAFVISSFGKTYHATGWKVGYCVAPEDMTVEFRKIHQFVTFTTHTPTQWAIADYLENFPEHHRELPAFYQKKRDLFLEESADLGFVMQPSAGTYFQLADYSALSNMPDTEFVERLTREAGVAAIPVSVFYETPPESRLIRFCFAKDDDTLRDAIDRLRRFFK